MLKKVSVMSISDGRMDRALRGLGGVPPRRSAWLEIEERLNRADRGRRWRRWFGLSASGVAASLMAAVLVSHQWQPASDVVVDLQKTIDAAIRDARPAARFSGLEYNPSQSDLRALLISAEPRSQLAILPIGAAATDQTGALPGSRQQFKEPESTVNEF
jgi:hypothetical protein